MQQIPATTSVFGYGDCIMWPFRSAQWFGQVVLMSLIALIPFVGGMSLAGWALVAADGLHEGTVSVPPAGFYLRRGARLYFVGFVWSIIAAGLLYALMFGFMAAFIHPRILGAPSFFVFSAGWVLFVFGFGLVTHLAFLFIVPGAIEADARGAIRGLNPIHALGDVFRHPKESLFAALVTYVGWIFAGLGASLCYVGIILTLGYGALVFAGALYVYERNTAVSAV